MDDNLLMIKLANDYPFDAPDSWWNDISSPPQSPSVPKDAYHSAARAVIHDLQDRRDIKHLLRVDRMDEEVRQELVATLASIIKTAVSQA